MSRKLARDRGTRPKDRATGEIFFGASNRRNGKSLRRLVGGGVNRFGAFFAIILAALETMFEGCFIVIFGMAYTKLGEAFFVGLVAISDAERGLEAGAVFGLFALKSPPDSM